MKTSVAEGSENKDHRWLLVVCEGDSLVTAPRSVDSAAQISGSAAPVLCSAISVRSRQQRHSSLS